MERGKLEIGSEKDIGKHPQVRDRLGEELYSKGDGVKRGMSILEGNKITKE